MSPPGIEPRSLTLNANAFTTPLGKSKDCGRSAARSKPKYAAELNFASDLVYTSTPQEQATADLPQKGIVCCRSAAESGKYTGSGKAQRFGDEDQYDLLFEDKPSVVNVIIINAYENHQPNICYRNYANVTEIPELTAVGFLEAPPTNSDDNISIKISSVSNKSQDSEHETVSASKSDKPASSSDPRCSTRMLKPNDPEVPVEVSDDVLYENTPRSRGGSVKSMGGGERKYYMLERQLDEDTERDHDSGMVENILYQSITEKNAQAGPEIIIIVKLG